MGKGGGGAPQPTTQTVQQSNIPEYARPYFEDILTRGTTVSNTAYQPYTGQRVADFTPMQQQAFQGIQNLGPSPLLQPAAGLTGAAGLGGLGAGAQYTQQATSPGAMQAYMSPYMQNVVDWQKTQAIQDYGRQLPGQQAAAARAGAFGGSRQAIVESEAQRNLQNQLGGIQAQGTQAAFDQANKNLQFGSQLGLQGLGLAGQMGQQFGQLGQTAFGQQAAAAQAQQQAGAIQQAQEQQKKDVAYEEFMRQQLYPQSQLQFLSSLLRGSVVAPQQTMYSYQAQPSMVSQLGGLGLGALGLSKAFGAKEGGEVPGYADGGVTGGEGAQGVTLSRVTRAKKEIMQGVIPKDQMAAMIALKQLELEKAKSNQQALDAYRQQAQQPTVYDEEMGKLASAGVTSLDAGVMDDGVFAAAGGGIVAFAGGKEVVAPPGVRYEPEQPAASPFGRFFQDVSRGQKQNIEEEYWRRELMKKYGPQAGLGGLFSAQSDEERARAKAILDRSKGMSLAELRDMVQNPEAGLPAALPQPTAAKPTTAITQQPTQAAPAAPAAPAARAVATSAPAIKPAVDEGADIRKMVSDQEKKLQTEDQAEAARREAYKKAIPDDLQERLNSYKAEAAEALKERDKDRWLAVAMGGFTAAAASSPYALRNLAEGFNMTTKEMMTINKDFRKLESERQKLIREEQRLDRAEKLGIEKDIFAARDRATARRDSFDQYKTNVELNLAKIANDKWKTLTETQSAERRTGMLVGGRGDAAEKKDPLLARSNKLALAVADGSATPSEQAEYASLQEQIRKRSEATKTKAPSALKPSDVATATAFMNAAIKKNDLVSAKRYADMLGIDLPVTGGSGKAVLTPGADGVLEYKPAPR